MRRLIFGAIALVTGVAATIGLVVRRRRGRQEDVLPIEPAPPLRSAWEVGSAEAGVAAAPAKPKRRHRRKPAGAGTGAGASAAAEPSAADDMTERGSNKAAATETEAAPKRRPPRRKPAASSASETTGSTDAAAAGAGSDPSEPTEAAGAP